MENGGWKFPSLRSSILDLPSSIFGGPNSGVMAGRHIIEAKRIGTREQGAESDVAVAGQAGVRCIALRILAQEVVDHVLAKLALVVEDIVRDAELGADAPGAFGDLLRTAQAFLEPLV